MIPRINKIQYKKDFIYHIRFEDNRAGDIDFKPFLWGKAFKKLEDLSFFQRASIEETTGTISWPNGVDIAPETLYEKIISNAQSLSY